MFALNIYHLLNKTFDVKWLFWLPETLFREMKHVLLIDPDRLMRDKIYAIRSIINHELPFRYFHIFEKVACAFNDIIPNFAQFQMLYPRYLTWAIVQIKNIRNDDFYDEVKEYVRTVFKYWGLRSAYPLFGDQRSSDVPKSLIEEFISNPDKIEPLSTDIATQEAKSIARIFYYVAMQKKEMFEEAKRLNLDYSLVYDIKIT